MDLFTDKEKEALKDGADALRYRAARLKNLPEYGDNFPWSEEKVKSFEEHAKMLEEIAESRM